MHFARHAPGPTSIQRTSLKPPDEPESEDSIYCADTAYEALPNVFSRETGGNLLDFNFGAYMLLSVLNCSTPAFEVQT